MKKKYGFQYQATFRSTARGEKATKITEPSNLTVSELDFSSAAKEWWFLQRSCQIFYSWTLTLKLHALSCQGQKC